MRAPCMFARTLPPWLVDTFNEITDYRPIRLVPRSARRPDPAGAPRLAPLAGRIANLVLLSLVVRLRLSVPRDRAARTGRHGHQAPDRPRAPLGAGPFAYFPWSWQHEYASLPSGHSTTAFAAAVAIAALWPRTRIPMLIFAVVIAMSRVVITAHFVSDVVAAAFVGAFGAIVVRNWFAARGLAFVPESDGAVHVRPGPSWRRIKAVARGLIGQ